MSLLEQRYRRVLRLLPATYRAEREDEMVSAFLDGAHATADEDNPRPHWREIASVAALAVRIRLGANTTRPRHHAWGQAVRLAVLGGLGFYAATGVWTATRPPLDGTLTGLPATAAAGVVMAVAFALLATGRVRAAKTAAAVGLVPYAVEVALAADRLADMLSRPGKPSPARLPLDAVPLLVMAVPFVLVAAFAAGYHRDVRPPRLPAAVAVAPVAAGLAVAVAERAAIWLIVPTGALGEGWHWIAMWVSEAGLACLALAGAAAAHTVARLRTGRHSAAVPLALALLSAPAALIAAIRIAPGAAGEIADVMNLTAAGQALLLALCCLAMLTVGLRSLPPAPPPAQLRPAD
ncbi:hypothetical protein [Sinosporangium siamense]|uniref:Uncharacterized protein n=1 Tax=Sinosporangium siamense TaxID=1367973 RepID=A0A919VDC7_9ACTN|nr:hypothetical protein [Sinosporangium siamense]GII94009.1 hypothetical protein Ssi02_42400 [Sinosporangium siamense]